MPDRDRPHAIDRGRGLEPASTEEIAPLVRQHAVHDGIAYFPACEECVKARRAGRYPQWFPPAQEDP